MLLCVRPFPFFVKELGWAIFSRRSEQNKVDQTSQENQTLSQVGHTYILEYNYMERNIVLFSAEEARGNNKEELVRRASPIPRSAGTMTIVKIGFVAVLFLSTCTPLLNYLRSWPRVVFVISCTVLPCMSHVAKDANAKGTSVFFDVWGWVDV